MLVVPVWPYQIRGENGADNGTRTRGLNLGKVALYQLSYVRSAERLKSLPYLFSAWQVQEGFRRVLLSVCNLVLRNLVPRNLTPEVSHLTTQCQQRYAKRNNAKQH